MKLDFCICEAPQVTMKTTFVGVAINYH